MEGRLQLIRGGVAVDDRGSVTFVNDFVPAHYVRMYTVSNHEARFIRAWHGHRVERKAAMVLSGTALVCAVEVDDWESPSPDLPVHRFVLSEAIPSALVIPPGYANGFMSLTPNTRVCFFSSASIEEAPDDDVRFNARLWDPWSVDEH